MLPQKRNEVAGNDECRAVFEVRVIDGTDAASADEHASELEIGLRIGDGGATEWTTEEEEAAVLRLEAGGDLEPLLGRPMSEAGPCDPSVTLARRRKGLGLKTWTVWMSAASCLLAIAAVLGVYLQRNSAAQAPADKSAYLFEKEQVLDAAEERFVANSGKMIAEAKTMLERYAKATSVEQALRRVRDGERVKERMRQLWQPWGGASMLAPGSTIRGEVETGEYPLIRLKGRRGDYTPFVMTFLCEGDRLVLDWEASFGIGDVQIEELRDGAAADGAVVRAIVRPDAFYTRAFPEASFRSYHLLDASGENSVWAFAPRGSAAAAALAEIFNEGSVLFVKAGATRATLRVSRLDGSAGQGLVITEMLHKGWVSP